MLIKNNKPKCKHFQDIKLEFGGKCKLGHYGGTPSFGTCRVCEFYEGPDRGIGDIIYKVAQPIAKTIDKIAGTNIKGCQGCKERRKKLNNKMPFQ